MTKERIYCHHCIVVMVIGAYDQHIIDRACLMTILWGQGGHKTDIKIISMLSTQCSYNRSRCKLSHAWHGQVHVQWSDTVVRDYQ